MKALLNHDSIGDGQALAGSNQKYRRKCHEAESADLDTAQDYDLSEQRKARTGVHDGQTRDAGGRCCGKKCIDQPQRWAALD